MLNARKKEKEKKKVMMQQIKSGTQRDGEKTRRARMSRAVRRCVGVKDTRVGYACVGRRELKDDYEGRRDEEEVLERIGYGKTRAIMYGMMGCKQNVNSGSKVRCGWMPWWYQGEDVPCPYRHSRVVWYAVCGMRDEHANRRYEDNSRWYDMIHITETTVRGRD